MHSFHCLNSLAFSHLWFYPFQGYPPLAPLPTTPTAIKSSSLSHKFCSQLLSFILMVHKQIPCLSIVESREFLTHLKSERLKGFVSHRLPFCNGQTTKENFAFDTTQSQFGEWLKSFRLGRALLLIDVSKDFSGRRISQKAIGSVSDLTWKNSALMSGHLGKQRKRYFQIA